MSGDSGSLGRNAVAGLVGAVQFVTGGKGVRQVARPEELGLLRLGVAHPRRRRREARVLTLGWEEMAGSTKRSMEEIIGWN